MENLSYDNFINIILAGSIRGKDVLNLCRCCKKFNGYGNKSFEVRDKDGKIIRVETQRLFRILLKKIGISFIPYHKLPKNFYIERVIGGNVWGFGVIKALGLDRDVNIKESSIPIPIPGLYNIVQASSLYHSLWLDNQGKVWAVESNKDGKLGLGNTNRLFNILVYTPTMITTLEEIVQVAVGDLFSLCLDRRGNVYGFGTGRAKIFETGRNGIFEKPAFPNHISNLPFLIPDLCNIIQISSGSKHALFLDNEGRVWGLGSDEFGQLGLGNYKVNNTVTLIPGLENIVQVDAGETFSICLDDKRKVWGFGWKDNGSRPSDMSIYTNIPKIIDGLEDIVQVSIGNDFYLCLDNKGRVWSFGFNRFGQLGLGDNVDREQPTMIPGLDNIVEISAKSSHCLCLDNKGRVWAFGRGDQGQLGLGNSIDKNKPMLIPGLNSVFSVSAGYNSSMVITF
jgi:alpha-tubulin suppressor-like RCC1 family protein